MSSPFSPRRSTASLCLVVCVVVVLATRMVASEWRATTWRGERAWESVSCGGTAVVSEERARLIALMPAGGGENLLFADLKNEFSWGGHRFWLGPQTAWVAPWPPPSDWETSAAARVEADGAVLRVEHPHTNKNYPPIVRTYAWREGVLHCTATWSDPRYQGIHVVQIPPRAVVRVKRRISEALPLGYVLLPVYKRDGVLIDREVSPLVAKVDGDVITLRNANATEKIGVYPQTIVAEIDGHRLELRRGKMAGMSSSEPDMGMLTQVFLGSDRSVFTEIEQLTPLGGPGEAVSEILLEVTKLGSESGPALKNPVRR